MPVVRDDGQTDDYCQIGNHSAVNTRYISHLDNFGPTGWSKNNDGDVWRPATFIYCYDPKGYWTEHQNIDMCGQGDMELVGGWKQNSSIEKLKEMVIKKGYSCFTVSAGEPSFDFAAMKKFNYQVEAEHCKPIT